MNYDPNAMDVPPDSDPGARMAAARQRVLYPAIFLIVVNALNVVFAIVFAGLGFIYREMPPAQVEKMEQLMAERNPNQWDEVKRQGYSGRSILDIASRFLFGWAGVSGICGVLVLVGAVRMVQLRSYGLAMFGSILSMVPCISPSSCLLLGLFAGIWSLVILMDAEVYSSFQ